MPPTVIYLSIRQVDIVNWPVNIIFCNNQKVVFLDSYVNLSDLYVDLLDRYMDIDLSDNFVVIHVCMALTGQEYVSKIYFESEK